jgi:DNA-binding PucR family transcriptional regulator
MAIACLVTEQEESYPSHSELPRELAAVMDQGSKTWSRITQCKYQLLQYADRTLGPVRAHDCSRKTELVQTLRTYFSTGLVSADTARLLQVHPNTVKQRLRRIQTLTNIDLAHPNDTMELAVALTVGDVAQASLDR